MKNIPGFPGYSISEDGLILVSHQRVEQKQLRFRSNRQGYIQCTVSRDKKHYTTGVHRMVALTYVPNDDPKNKKQVHHKDHNKENNHYSNLEWVTPSDNIILNYKTGGQIPKAGLQGKFGIHNPESKLIRQLHPEDGVMRCFWSLREAAEATNSSPRHIWSVCRGRLKKHNGFIWRYVF